jgi:hypothetical protein
MMLRATWLVPTWAAAALLGWNIAAAQSGSPADNDAAARSAIHICIRQIDNVPRGAAELNSHCPELMPSLQAAHVAPLIISSSRDRLDRSSLIQLQRLLHPAISPAPSVPLLAPIIRQLEGPPATQRSWWRRFWDWVLKHFDRKDAQPSSNSWMAEIARQLARAHWLWQAIIWAVFIGLGILVAIVVVREVRVMRRHSSEDVGPQPLEKSGAGPPVSRLALLHQVPLGQRPAQLFRMLVSRLVAAGRLPPDRSLTHREIVRSVVLDDAGESRYLAALARLSERQLYSQGSAMPADLDQILGHGEDLYITGWSRPRSAE